MIERGSVRESEACLSESKCSAALGKAAGVADSCRTGASNDERHGMSRQAAGREPLAASTQLLEGPVTLRLENVLYSPVDEDRDERLDASGPLQIRALERVNLLNILNWPIGLAGESLGRPALARQAR